jgi:hypothetical protein
MPAFGNITINDGAATPVARTFEPVDIDQSNVSHYAEVSGGIPIGYGRLSISLRPPAVASKNGSNSADSVYRAKLKLDLPTLEVTSPSTGTGLQPAPTVAYTTVGTAEFILPARGALAERDNVLTLMRNAMAHATVEDVVMNLKNIY